MRKKIAVIYHSQSGNTQEAARSVAEGVKEAGDFEVVLLNTNEARVAPAILAECAGAAFGTPDYFGYPAGGMKMFIDDWLIARRGGNERIEGLPLALFMTHGGGGAAREPFEGLFRRIGQQVGETLCIKGKPTQADCQACRDLGAALAARAKEYAARAE